MTNKTVTMSRELAKSALTIVARNCTSNWSARVKDGIESVLASPSAEPLGVVEPNKCGQCSASTTDICNQNGCGFLESGNGEPVVERQPKPCEHEWTDDGGFLLVCTACGAQEDFEQALQLAFELGGTEDGSYQLEADELCEVIRRFASPPELAELRATVARLETQLNKAINLEFERRAEIECVSSSWHEMKCGLDNAKDEVERLKGSHREAVVLPEMKSALQVLGSQFDDAQCQGWNACIDKIKELNQ